MREFIWIVVLSTSIAAHAVAQDFPSPGTPAVAAPSVSVRYGDLPVAALQPLPELNFRDADLRDVFRAIAAESGLNLIVDNEIEMSVTVGFRDVATIDAVRYLVESNGLSLTQTGSIFTVHAPAPVPPAEPTIRVTDGSLFVDVQNVEVDRFTRAVTRASGRNVVLARGVQGSVSGFLQDAPFEQGLRTLLSTNGFELTVRDEIYIVERGQPAPEVGYVRNGNAQLVRLGYARASTVLGLLPASITERISVQVVPEQNAFIAVGPGDAVAELRAFVAQLDFPAPQILIDALVVDFLDTDQRQSGLFFSRGVLSDSARGQYSGDLLGNGGFQYQGGASDAQSIINRVASVFGLGSVGTLPDDFYFRIRALAQEGRALIRSRPQLSTINGNTARLRVGTTQYYILTTTTPYATPGNVVTQTSEQFVTIEANVTLEVTPFVNPNGTVTVNIKPEFSTPSGSFSSETPPTINTRSIESTVRLQDGQTIILGGVISDEEVDDYNKIPILGDIPLLGRLFRGRTKRRQRSELVIYLTPHVFYGGPDEEAQWRSLASQFELQGSPYEPAVTPRTYVPDGVILPDSSATASGQENPDQ